MAAQCDGADNYLSLARRLPVLLLACILWQGCRTIEPVNLQAREIKMTPEQAGRYADAQLQLYSVDPEARRSAAVALLSMEHPQALETVKEAIRSADSPEVRISAIAGAEFLVDHRCFAALVDALDDPDLSVRQGAARALSRFTRPDEVDTLKSLVNQQETNVERKKLLFEAFGRGMMLRAVPLLVAGLRSGNDEVSAAAHRALTKIAGRELPPSAEEWQRWWDANRFRTREDRLQERILSLSQELDAARQELTQMREQFQELLELVNSAEAKRPELLLGALRSEHGVIREFAAVRLSALNQERLKAISLDEPETYALFQDALASDSAQLREAVIRLVVRLQGSYRLPLVEKALNDVNPRVQVEAMGALREGASSSVVGKLGELVAQSSHETVREAAANALGRIGAEESAGKLIAALEDEAENVRWFAVESLRKLGAARALPQLAELLRKDKSARVREMAAITLGELGQPAAIPELKNALADENERVREKAVAALKELAGGDCERMTIIADALVDHGYYETAADVLRKAVEMAGQDESQVAQLARTRQRLARVLEKQGNYEEAATVYQELLATAQDKRTVRRELLGCWVRAGTPGGIASALAAWLEEAAESEREEIIQLGGEIIQVLREKEEDAVAAEIQAVIDQAQPEEQKPTAEMEQDETSEPPSTTEPPEAAP